MQRDVCVRVIWSPDTRECLLAELTATVARNVVERFETKIQWNLLEKGAR